MLTPLLHATYGEFHSNIPLRDIHFFLLLDNLTHLTINQSFRNVNTNKVHTKQIYPNLLIHIEKAALFLIGQLLTLVYCHFLLQTIYFLFKYC